MKDIGFYGMNLGAAAHKVVTAKTPEEAKFRNALINNDEARAVVDKVDFVKAQMEDLDHTKLDTNGQDGQVEVDAQAKQLGKVGRWMGAANKPLEAITTQAPAAEQKPQVAGTLKDGDMKVDVTHAPGQTTTFSYTQKQGGEVVYQAGNEVVTMNPDGTLSMTKID